MHNGFWNISKKDHIQDRICFILTCLVQYLFENSAWMSKCLRLSEKGHICFHLLWCEYGRKREIFGSHWAGTNSTAKWASNIGLDGDPDNALWNFPMEIVSMWKQFVRQGHLPSPTILMPPTFTKARQPKDFFLQICPMQEMQKCKEKPLLTLFLSAGYYLHRVVGDSFTDNFLGHLTLSSAETAQYSNPKEKKLFKYRSR